MDARARAARARRGAHIVVGTPGRLRDHLERGRSTSRACSAVVLDEADEMLDLGFREDLEFILDATPAERRTLLFSATMPREIAALAKRYQRDAVRIDTMRRNEPHGDIEYRAIRVRAQRASRTRSSTCCASTRPAARWCSAPPAKRCAPARPPASSAASPPWRCPAN